MKKLVLCIILSGLCMTNSYASDSDYINWLRQELNTRNATMLEMQNTISRQDQTIRNLEGQLSYLRILFDGVLNMYYSDGFVQLSIQRVICEELGPITMRQEPFCKRLDSLLPGPSGKVDESKVKAFYNAIMKIDDKEALVALQKLITKHNDSALTPYVYYKMGDIYYRMGMKGPIKYKEKNYAKAKENFLRVLSVTKFKDSATRADSIYSLGRIYLEQKNLGLAKEYFTLVVQQYPHTNSAWFAQIELELIEYVLKFPT